MVTKSMIADAALKERAAAVMPGGVYGHESTAYLPKCYPQFIERGEGAHIWDADGNRYVDYMCAYGPNLFGYGHREINRAAIAQIEKGDAMTGPSPVMVDLAEKFVLMVSHADWAMFCKNGTDATTMAMTIARAHSGKRKILVAAGAYHGAAPWCTPIKTGVLAEERAHQIEYQYNDIESLEEAVRLAGDDLAAIFATPFKHDAFADQAPPSVDYAVACRRHCDRSDALLIVDDVRAGFRIARDCSWSTVGVKPDLSAWGKCIANGHAISALLGSDRARKAAASIYATGSFWFAAAPMAAALKTLELVATTDYLERMIVTAERLRAGLAEQAKANGFAIRQTGPAQMPQILFEDDPDFRLGFYWAAEALKRGAYLHPWHNMFFSAAHSEQDVKLTLEATGEAFSSLKKYRADAKPHEGLMALFQKVNASG